jgi:DNA-binding winged helix-turn-helix (wHTH) protein
VPIYRFGPFQLDSESRRLTRDAHACPLSDRHLEVLLQLVTQPGAIVTKDALIDAAWRDVAVTDNSLEQAISVLRRTLGDVDGQPFIETVPRRGYRFVATVSREARRESDEGLAALLAPHRAWLEGRTLLETLERPMVAAAEAAFRRAHEALPDFAAPHIGLANANAFRFEASRSQVTPDVEALQRAVTHAREACRLDSGLAESWATLGFVLSRAGHADDALAASRRAVTLEPDNWRHQLRLAFVSWGEERLRASSRTLRLMPGLSLAHFLAATVYVARQSFDRAERELDSGAAQETHPASASRFSSVGGHWVRGLLHLRAGDEQQARDAFARELTEGAAHLYGAECGANVHYALGVMAWRAGNLPAALEACDRALVLAPAHRLVSAVRSVLSGTPPSDGFSSSEWHNVSAVDAAIVASVPDVARGDHHAAAARVQAALAEASAGSQGWTLPLDPFFDLRSHGEAWAGTLGLLRTRAA